ncbi:MAG: radical SAM family heme chaperone HemW [Cytophagaceae bacterium]
MAGIYIHIPFCKKACHYCNFHFSTNLSLKTDMVKAIIHELHLRKDYLDTKILNTIYFGGGTPSILDEKDFGQLFDTIYCLFNVDKEAEITLEANPDDLNKEKIHSIRTYFNRLSIGTQSFDDKTLAFLNRSHNAKEAMESLMNAKDAGFVNISIDLIYGIPEVSISQWESDLMQAIKLEVPHLSCYGFTIEPGTVFGNWQSKGKLTPQEEDLVAEQFLLMIQVLNDHNYEHYEISNFSKPGMYSRHNTSYWFGEKYLGIGPGAHSYNGVERQFNIENNHRYVNSIKENIIPGEKEVLSAQNILNEYLLTSLRTQWGTSIEKLVNYGYNSDVLEKQLKNYVKDNFLSINDKMIFLTAKGKLIADEITLDLMV